MEKTISALLVVIPHEQQGALETAMLAAIAEDPYDKSIVEKTGVFASRMREEASHWDNGYISLPVFYERVNW